jgi:hypothetical protein
MYSLHVKWPLFFLDFKETLILSTFSKNAQIENFINIRPEASELFYVGTADGIHILLQSQISA